LRAQAVEAGGIIVRRGEPATCMYFIAAGEVEVELPKERVRPWGRTVLRRDCAAAPFQPFRHRDGGHARQSSRARCARFSTLSWSATRNSPSIINEIARTRAGERVTPKGDIAGPELTNAKEETDEGPA